MNSIEARMDRVERETRHLEHQVRELEYANKLLCQAIVSARVFPGHPRAELWAWLQQTAKGEE